MKQFRKAIEVICADCRIRETVPSETVKEAKQLLKENYGWSETNIGWICTECAESQQTEE